MSYRSVKRLLGEQSLERKAHLIFGTFLLLLIIGTFWWINSISERVIKENMIERADATVSVALLQVHYDKFGPPEGQTAGEQEQAYKIGKEIMPDKIKLSVLVDDESKILEEDGATYQNIKPVAADPGERKLISQLMATIRARESSAPKVPIAKINESQNSALPAPVFVKNVHVYRDFQEYYQFYKPIKFTPTCFNCHHDKKLVGDEDIAVPIYPRNPPQHFVRIEFPSRGYRKAINRSRASMLALAIASAFVSMFAMYVVVRYVVVKPLNHLRSVSDEISKGNTYLRADLHTGDEFQQLASSFNKMLRHLVDTQSKLRDVNLDLDAKVDELAQLNLQLYDSNKLKSEFLANMSHELRTPLNSIIGFSEVLQSFDSLNDKQKKFARNIQDSGRVLLEMINEILDLAKIEAGKMQLKPTEFDLSTVIDAHCNIVGSLVDEKNIELVTETPEMPLVFQDQAKFQQILTNLISNAIKFTPEGGQIFVRTRSRGNHFSVEVEDTGVGIADEDLEIIFEKFRQGASATGDSILTREYQGTGLGLSIVKEMCILLGGSVTVESEIGQGSIFTVTLPISCPVDSQRDSEIASRFNQISRDQQQESRRAESI